MNTTISFNATSGWKRRKLVNLLEYAGFRNTSEYLRYLLAQDDVDLISEHELKLGRAADVDKLYKDGKTDSRKIFGGFNALIWWLKPSFIIRSLFRNFGKLPDEIKNRAIKTEALFRQDPL